MTPTNTAQATGTGDASPVTLCTWTSDCPRPGQERVEDPSMGGGSVEFVCPIHSAAAHAAGYRSTDPAGQGTAGPAPGSDRRPHP